MPIPGTRARRTPKVVFSRALREPGHGAQVINGENLVEQVTELKTQPGKDLLLMGGASLAADLTAHGLVDEHQVVVHPVVLGGGKALFPETKQRLDLQLADSRIFDARSVLLRHHPASR